MAQIRSILPPSLPNLIFKIQGTARPSMTHWALVDCEPGKISDDIIMFTATQVYGG